ncbi:hypothetical protein BDV95DRAFT_106042 [Massariosphaeria phaeospora]|uniref:Uncharacterized protein n=1 Tax=Massariosphaeria phaeospora TaxID=100035 RepID=A0A7C8I280_9PLEO|nr:hypothetical protein BDV95DRAFT_106042 [Massariosphaeria phaeospora]
MALRVSTPTALRLTFSAAASGRPMVSLRVSVRATAGLDGGYAASGAVDSPVGEPEPPMWQSRSVVVPCTRLPDNVRGRKARRCVSHSTASGLGARAAAAIGWDAASRAFYKRSWATVWSWDAFLTRRLRSWRPGAGLAERGKHATPAAKPRRGSCGNSARRREAIAGADALRRVCGRRSGKSLVE